MPRPTLALPSPLRALACVLALLFVPIDVTAQEVHIQGRVLEDESEAPIEETTVQLLSPGGDVIDDEITGEDGQFRFSLERREGVRLRAERIGYADNLSPVLYLENRTFFEVELRLRTDAVLLAPLEVVARSEPSTSGLAEFEHRRERGMGRYITREMIEERNPIRVSDLLADIPGVRLTRQGRGTRRQVVMSRSPGSCPASLWVDGLQVNRGPVSSDVSIDDVVSPESVYGIEVYRGGSTVPADFIQEGACGVVAVWTRRGDGS